LLACADDERELNFARLNQRTGKVAGRVNDVAVNESANER
jgi:hypothetical protein